MDFFPTEEQRMIQETARDFAEKELKDRQREKKFRVAGSELRVEVGEEKKVARYTLPVNGLKGATSN